MCLKVKFPFPKKAKEDIKVYKVLMHNERKDTLYSPYMHTKTNVTDVNDLSGKHILKIIFNAIFKFKVEDGFIHCCKELDLTLKMAKILYMTTYDPDETEKIFLVPVIYECTIPKWTYYYENKDFVASRKLIYNKQINIQIY